MVFIKKLELSGFKTFACKTVLTFDRGLNIIVGPNGSGKSNIVDAIQFVLGERSTRMLRVKSFPDLLFSGNNEHQRAKRATVTIRIDNIDRKIPIDSDEVVITRSISLDGSSTLKVNGMKYSWNALVDVLSMASLIGGMNIVFQGTTIRIAESPPEERRKTVEQIIGLAEYDRKRKEAEAELREAETNIKFAKGKYEEVKIRLIELETGRNIVLSYNYLSSLLNRFKAVRLSVKVKSLLENLEEVNSVIENLTAERDELDRKRIQLEAERRKVQDEYGEYAREVVEKGGDKLVQLQAQLGNLNATLAVQKSTLSSIKSAVRSLQARRDEKQLYLENLKKQAWEIRKELRRLIKEKEELESHLSGRQQKIEYLKDKISSIRLNLNANTSTLKELEKKIKEFEAERGRLYLKIRAEKGKENSLISQIASMEDKRKSLEEIFNNIAQRLERLKEFRHKEEKSLEETVKAINLVQEQIIRAEEEIKKAEAVAEKAKLNVTAFKSKKDLAERVLSEEKALSLIENLSSMGVLQGVCGRLRNLIKIPAQYKQAVEAAAEGWLQALVVENLEVVKKCAESLKRAKIGRIKIIPLSEVKDVASITKPRIEGLLGSLASLVESSSKFKPALNFILGDTFLASSAEVALKASQTGFRAVTVEGEVFEPGPKLTLGFYREPIDLSEVVPSDKTIDAIDETVVTFEKLLKRRRTELERLRKELVRLESERVNRKDNLKFFNADEETLKNNLSRNKRLIAEVDRKIKSLNDELERSRALINELEGKKAILESELSKLRSKAEKLRTKVRPECIMSLEGERAQLEAEVMELSKRLSEIENRAKSLQETFEMVYTPNLATARKELAELEGELKRQLKLEEETTAEIARIDVSIKELAAERDKLTVLMASRREEHQRFSETLKKIDEEYGGLIERIRRIEGRLNELKERKFRLQTEYEECLRGLKELGFERPLEPSQAEVEVSELLMGKLEDEKKRLYSQLNMNAPTLYEPHKRDYKELSAKINKLEEEKREILNFMEAVEREKKEAFYSALEKLNQRFAEAFNAITGGRGWIQLQNPEDPFSGGLDLIVEFPGKPPMPVTALSGGEKSVVAVCYIFALQSLTRASPFYVFDEVDAHLDPLNTERLAELLVRESKKVQIIAVSFKEPMAIKADRLFGIYAKNGVSYVHTLPAEVVKLNKVGEG